MASVATRSAGQTTSSSERLTGTKRALSCQRAGFPALSRVLVGSLAAQDRYWIEIDGVRVGKVARGEQAVFSVTAGQHNVRATLDWSGSPVVVIDVADGESISLTVEPAGDPLAALSQFWKRDAWLKLAAD